MEFEMNDWAYYGSCRGKIIDKYNDPKEGWTYIFQVTANDHLQYFSGTELTVPVDSPMLKRRKNYRKRGW